MQGVPDWCMGCAEQEETATFLGTNIAVRTLSGTSMRFVMHEGPAPSFGMTRLVPHWSTHSFGCPSMGLRSNPAFVPCIVCLLVLPFPQ